MKTIFISIWIHIRWFVSSVPVNLFGILTSPFMFPIAWMFRGLGKYSPFWMFKVPSSRFNEGSGNNNITITKNIIDDLRKYDGTKIKQDGRWEARAEIKYMPTNSDDDIWQVNTGEIQSNTTSIIGTGYILYKIGNWHSFRFSKSFEIKLINRNCTIWMGTNNSTNMLAFKFQKIKPWDIKNKTNNK